MTTHKPKDTLSNREQTVAELISKGMRNPEIADHLGLSRKTIENHVRSILQKWELKNRAQVAVKVITESVKIISPIDLMIHGY